MTQETSIMTANSQELSKIWVIHCKQNALDPNILGKIAGFYNSKKAAQVHCNKINAPVLERYNSYRDSIIEPNERATAEYEETAPALWDFLEEHDLYWAAITDVEIEVGEGSNSKLVQMNNLLAARRLGNLS